MEHRASRRKDRDLCRVLEPFTKGGLLVCTTGITPTWPSWRRDVDTQVTRGQCRCFLRERPSPKAPGRGAGKPLRSVTSRVSKRAVRPLATEAGGRLGVACRMPRAHAVAPGGPGLPWPFRCPLTALARGEAGEGEETQGRDH